MTSITITKQLPVTHQSRVTEEFGLSQFQYDVLLAEDGGYLLAEDDGLIFC